MEEYNVNHTARQVLEIIPLVMRIVTAELRRGTHHPIVPAQLGVLTILAQRSCNLSELAEQHAVSLPTMSSTVSKMVEQGWVARARSSHDRRHLLIKLTPAGRTVLEQITAQMVTRVAELLTPLTAEAHKDLTAGLAVLQQVFAVPINH